MSGSRFAVYLTTRPAPTDSGTFGLLGEHRLKPPLFSYLDPTSVGEVMGALAHYGDDAKLLAGGQSLVPLLNMRLSQPRALIDLNRIQELRYIHERSRDGVPGLSIGAMTRQSSVEHAGREVHAVPLLGEALRFIGHPQIRNRGTVGGSIAHADPTAELPVVFLALDGIATVQVGDGERTIPARDFFAYTFSPALESDELLTEIWFPAMPRRTGQAFFEVARRHGDFALVSAAVSLSLDPQGICTHASIALGGAAPVPMRATKAESALLGQRVSTVLCRDAARLVSSEVNPTADVHADAAYRRDVAAVLVERGLMAAWNRIPGSDG